MSVSILVKTALGLMILVKTALGLMIGRLLAYLFGIAIGLDVLANAILAGRPYTTISCRIGLSIEAGGWAARVPWPAWWLAHCRASVFQTIV